MRLQAVSARLGERRLRRCRGHIRLCAELLLMTRLLGPWEWPHSASHPNRESRFSTLSLKPSTAASTVRVAPEASSNRTLRSRLNLSFSVGPDTS
jgi:hypothetical protein